MLGQNLTSGAVTQVARPHWASVASREVSFSRGGREAGPRASAPLRGGGGGGGGETLRAPPCKQHRCELETGGIELSVCPGRPAPPLRPACEIPHRPAQVSSILDSTESYFNAAR